MEISPTAIPEVVLITPRIFRDDRGYFLETFNAREFAAQVAPLEFVQDNESQSRFGVIRGLHYQVGENVQAKLVRAVYGKIIDVAVDMRRDSPSFGKAVCAEISAENKRQIFIPHGFAHGFSVLSEIAVVAYKCDKYYAPTAERGVLFSDPHLQIDWQIPIATAIVAAKDRQLPEFSAAEKF